MSAPPDLIAGYWTLAGPIRPGEAGDVSPWPLVDRIRAAADAGFRGIGFYYDDLAAVERRGQLAEARDCLADTGLRYGQFELGVTQWWGDGAARTEADRRIDDLVRWIDVLGLPDNHVKLLPELEGHHVPDGVYTAGLVDAATRTARVSAPIALEFLPFAMIATVEDAWRIVGATDRADCGIEVDAWHVFRGASRLASLRDVPSARIVNVELDDASELVRGALTDDTVDRRLLPGEGDLDLPGLLAALAAAGYDRPFAVEVISCEQRVRSLAVAAQRAHDTAAAQFSRATGRS